MKVTVLMVVRNGERFVRECMESVISQSFSDFEFLIIDDGSIDGTVEIIKRFNDSRIRLLQCPQDYIASLNLGLKESQGQYIARMDADDLMLPGRLEKQVFVLDNLPEIAICSTWAESFGEYNAKMCSKKNVVQFALLELMRQNYIIHPTVMLRKNFLIENHLLYKDYPYAEDYKLWSDMISCGGVSFVIPEILLLYRVSSAQTSMTHKKEQYASALKIQNEIMLRILNNDGMSEMETVRNIYLQLEKLNNKKVYRRSVLGKLCI